MTSLRQFFVAATVLLFSTGIVNARWFHDWSYQELFNKSDLVIIATPTATTDTKEQIGLPGMADIPAIGVETQLSVSVVLKGNKTPRNIILHYYRTIQLAATYPNGPRPISFDITKKKSYLLFLVRESDGRYAPTFGQTDPGMRGIDVISSNPEL